MEHESYEQHQEKKENSKQQQQHVIDGMLCRCCPVFNTFNIIGKKFSLLILRNMIYVKHKRFNEFLNSIDDINPKTLSIRLKEMEGDGIIRRQAVQRDSSQDRVLPYPKRAKKSCSQFWSKWRCFPSSLAATKYLKTPIRPKFDRIIAKSIKKNILVQKILTPFIPAVFICMVNNG